MPSVFSRLDAAGKQVVEYKLSRKSKRKRDTIENNTSGPNKVRKSCKEHEVSGSAPSVPNQRKRRHDEDEDDSTRKHLHLDPAPQDDPQIRPRKVSRPRRTRPLHSSSQDPGMISYLDQWRQQPGLPTCEDDRFPPRESNVKYWCYSHFHPLNTDGCRRKILYKPAWYEHMIRPHRQLIPEHARPDDITTTQSAPLQNNGGLNVGNSGSATP